MPRNRWTACVGMGGRHGSESVDDMPRNRWTTCLGISRSHVGKHYDLSAGGRDLRIVVIGQEYGQTAVKVDLEARTAMFDKSAGKGFRGRNPHMRGTTSILRLMLGRRLGTDDDGERLFGKGTAHIFDGFALVNALLCSAVGKPPEGMRAGMGASSRLMRKNCARHFRKTMEILEPTVIVAEGQGVRSWIGGPLGLGAKPASTYDGPARPEIARIAGERVDILTFNHSATSPMSRPGPTTATGWWPSRATICLNSRRSVSRVGPRPRDTVNLPSCRLPIGCRSVRPPRPGPLRPPSPPRPSTSRVVALPTGWVAKCKVRFTESKLKLTFRPRDAPRPPTETGSGT